MLHKSFDILETKADAEHGTFEATVAVFGNVDKGGDRILPGAFKNTLAKWAKSGDPIPVILSHQWNDPMAHIGILTDATETVKGLRVKGKLDVEDNPVAKQVHRLMTRRSLKEFSFGYSVPAGGQKRAKDGANDLSEVEIAEIGPTLKGMNPATELHAVKSMTAEELSDALGGLVSPTTEDLRKEAEKVERELNDERLPTDLPEPVKAIGGGTRGAIGNLVRYYASKPHPFTECVRDNTKRFGKDRAERICATLKRMGGRKADEPEVDWEQELYDAAGGNVEGLLEMWHDSLAADGEKMEEFLAKAVWTAAYINDLPDSAFLYVESGGSKDSEGKTTPRSLRHFPYKDAAGAVDLPHLRNALSRIPQSNLPQDVKDRLAAKAQRILDNLKSVDEETAKKTRSVDPLRKQADELALEVVSGGASLQKPPKAKPEPEPDLMSIKELRRRTYEATLYVLSDGTE